MYLFNKSGQLMGKWCEIIVNAEMTDLISLFTKDSLYFYPRSLHLRTMIEELYF